MTCERCEILEQRIRDMRGDCLPVPAKWGLTPKERIVLRCLVSRGFMTADGLMTAVYGYSNWPEIPVIAQMVSRIRRKAKRLGLDMRLISIRGEGYELIGHKAWQRKLEQGAP